MSAKFLFSIPAVSLSATQRKTIESLRDPIATGCKTMLAESAARTKAQRQVDNLAEEIASLENTVDPSNTAAVQNLSAKREQHALLVRRLPAPEPIELDSATLANLRTLCTEMGKLLKDHVEATQQQFAKILAPLFAQYRVKDAANEAYYFLNTTQLFKDLSQRFILNVRPEGDRLMDPADAIALADALLAGGDLFSGNWQNL